MVVFYFSSYVAMTITQIIQNARLLTSSNPAQVPDTTAILWLNWIYQEFCGDIRRQMEQYFYKQFFFDTVPYSNKYDLLDQTGTQFALQKIMQVSIKYWLSTYTQFSTTSSYDKWAYIQNGGRDYISKTTVSPWAFNASQRQLLHTGYIYASETTAEGKDLDSLNTGTINTSAAINPVTSVFSWSAVYFMWQNRDSNVMKQSLYVYPYVTETIIDGIKIEWIANAIDLVVWWAEDTILIERNYHDILVQWLMWMIYQSQNKQNEAIGQKQSYLTKKMDAILDITNRTYGRQYITTPNLYYLS